MPRLMLPCLLLVLAAGCMTPLARVAVDLGDLQTWQVVVGEGATPSEQYAAEEFQRLYAAVSGHEMEIVHVADPGRPVVRIGQDAAAGARTRRFDHDAYGPEELHITANAAEIVITGGRPRGALYGVYTFFEDYLGVRFLTAEHTHTPALTAPLALEPVDRTYIPTLKWRYAYYGENHGDHAFAARLRQNAIAKDERLGGRSPVRLINHTISGFLPWGTYGAEHPEYFCLRDGRRPDKIGRHQTYSIQPCFSNLDARRIMTSNLLARIEREYPQWKDYSLSQGDNYRYCTCDPCAAKDEAAGCHTGQLLEFVNAAAAEVEKQYPDVTVGTLIYQWTRTPPQGMRPRANVKLQLCSIECCQIHPISDVDCPMNTRFREDLAGWAELTDNIAIWHYNVNFRNYLVPCPNLFNLERNVRFFVENDAKGIFMQCAGNTTGAEFSDLRNYVICNLLWDPTRSGEQLMEEFVRLHYGRAAPPVRRFIDRVHTAARDSGKHRHCFGMARHYGLTAELGHLGLKDFEEAMALAESDAVRNRVEKLSIAAWRLVIEELAEVMVDGGDLPEEAKARLRPLAKKCFDLCRKHNVKMISEGLQSAEAEKTAAELLGFDLAS